MNRKEVTPVTQQRPGSAEPGRVPDLDRIGERVSSFWDDYAYALVASVGVLVVVVVVTALVRIARSRQRDRAVAGLTALVVLAWTSEGLWEVARFTLGLPLAAAGLWWVGMTAEREDDPDEVKQLREAERKRRDAIWAISWRRLLVAVRVMRPGAQTLSSLIRPRS